jgi:hypothetical protein
MTLIIERNSLKYYQFESFNQLGIKHGFFTRHGGVSPAPFNSLNMATTVGDTNENVIENLTWMFDCFGLDLSSRYDGWQVHSATTICVDRPRDVRSRTIRCDALLTDKADVTLVMRFGDCVPVLLYDRKLRIAGVYHAGWMGTVKKIGAAAVGNMTKVYGSDPANIIAGIGPSIGPDHFEVKQDVADQFIKAFPKVLDQIRADHPDKIMFNLWEANRLTLADAGVREIEVMEVCTVCNKQDWFSHRGDQGKTGRFGVLISMAE